MGTVAAPAAPDRSRSLKGAGALLWRRTTEVYATPSSAISDVVAPALLFLAILGMFGAMANLGAFEGIDYVTFLTAVGLLQATGLAGSGVGVGLARDIETGFVDRLRVAPFRLRALVFADLLAGVTRAFLPAVLVLAIAFALGAAWPGIAGLALVLVLALGFGMLVAGWSLVVALRTHSQGSAPLMQAPVILAILLSPAFAPRGALASWLETLARVNPVTFVIEATRAPFEASPAWADAWPGLTVVAAGVVLMVLLALRGLRRLQT